MEDRYVYRAKRKSDKKWIYGNLIHTDDGVYIIQNYVPKHLIGKYDVDPSTICQCTGMKDKLIWENDIVKISGHIYVCYWDEYNFEWGLKSKTQTVGLGYIDKCIIEVIGNIFDNPELLEV